MARNEQLLIIGADGGLGGDLVRHFSHGKSVLKTTRRRERLDDETLFLELQCQEDFTIPARATAAIVAAGVTGFEICQTNPDAHRINVEKTASLIARLLDAEVFTIYLSTSALFADTCRNPEERTPPDPGTAYGMQKSLCEKSILQYAASRDKENHLAIVRLTKVAAPDRPPLARWLDGWNRGTSADAFTDLRTSPVSARYVARGLEKIIAERIPGVLHLSGAAGCSYFELCRRLAGHLGVAPALVGESCSTSGKVKIYFNPANGALSMADTTRRTGIKPQSMEEFLSDCAAALREAKTTGIPL